MKETKIKTRASHSPLSPAFIAALLLSSVHLMADTSWTANSGDWSNGANWSAGVPATSGDTITFNYSENASSTIDSTWATAGSVDGLVFSADNYNYTIDQGVGVTSLSIGSGGISGSKTSGTINLNGSYDIAANQTWAPGAVVYMYGDLSGTEDLTLDGTKGLQFWSGNSTGWTGEFNLNGGTASIRNLSQLNRLGNQINITASQGTTIWIAPGLGGGDYQFSSDIDFGTRASNITHSFALTASASGTLTFDGELTGEIEYKGIKFSGSSSHEDYRTIISGNNTGLTQSAGLSSGANYGAIQVSGARLQLTNANAIGTGNSIYTNVGIENTASETVQTSGLYTIDGIDVSADLLAKLNFNGSGISHNSEFGMDGAGTSEFSGDLYLESNNSAFNFANVSLKADTGGVVTFSGTIRDIDDAHTGKSESITAKGGGTIVLEGANTYAADTTVAANTTLLANNTSGSATGVGAVIVEDDATLGGIGRIAAGSANGITAQSGASIAPGASIGSLILDGIDTTGPVLTMESGATFEFELGAGNSSDQLILWNYTLGDLVLNNTVINFADAQEGSYTLFEFYSDSGINAIASGLTDGLVIGTGLDDFSYTLDYNSDNIILNVIPETNAYALLLGLASMALLARRRC